MCVMDLAQPRSGLLGLPISATRSIVLQPAQMGLQPTILPVNRYPHFGKCWAKGYLYSPNSWLLLETVLFVLKRTLERPSGNYSYPILKNTKRKYFGSNGPGW